MNDLDRMVGSRSRKAKLGAWHAGRASVLRWLVLECGDGVLFHEFVDMVSDMADSEEKWARQLLKVDDLDEWENTLYITVDGC